MLYFEGRPILRFECRDRRALDAVFGTGLAPKAADLLGHGGATRYWMVTSSWWLSNVVWGLLGHLLTFVTTGSRGVRGCHSFRGRLPWGRFSVDDRAQLDGRPALLLDHGGEDRWWPVSRLMYYMRTTGDPSVLLGRCYLKSTLWGRKIFLGYVVLTKLGG